eukprot:gene66768-91446_t
MIMYRIAEQWQVELTQVEEALAKHPLIPVNSASMQSQGWVPPAPGAGLVYSQGKQLLIALGIEQRMLPGSV